MTKDLKIFKLKARGDAGSCKTELLHAFGHLARSFGMITALSSDGHDMLITSTKENRCALYEFNRSQETIERAANLMKERMPALSALADHVLDQVNQS